MVKAENILIIEDGLKKPYFTPQPINFNIEEGEFVEIVSDDKRLFKMLGLLIPFSQGELYIDNYRISSLTAAELSIFRTRNIGILFDDQLLIDQLTVLENVELPLQYHQMDKEARRNRTEEVLRQLNLDHRKYNYPNQLNGELLKEVELARALVIAPKLILISNYKDTISLPNFDGFRSKLQFVNEMGIAILICSFKKSRCNLIQRTITL